MRRLNEAGPSHPLGYLDPDILPVEIPRQSSDLFSWVLPNRWLGFSLGRRLYFAALWLLAIMWIVYVSPLDSQVSRGIVLWRLLCVGWMGMVCSTSITMGIRNGIAYFFVALVIVGVGVIVLSMGIRFALELAFAVLALQKLAMDNNRMLSLLMQNRGAVPGTPVAGASDAAPLEQRGSGAAV